MLEELEFLLHNYICRTITNHKLIKVGTLVLKYLKFLKTL